jgi:hypothetical protein
MKPEIQLLAEYFRLKYSSLQKKSNSLFYIGVALSILGLTSEQISNTLELDVEGMNWVAVITALLIQILAHWANIKCKKTLLISRDASRWFLITSSIEDVQTKIDKPTNDIRSQVDEAKLTEVVDAPNEPYYFSKSPLGLVRLVENLHESVFYTKSLLEISNKKNIPILAVAIGTVVLIVTSTEIFRYPSNFNPYWVSLAFLSIAAPIIVKILSWADLERAIKDLTILEERLTHIILLPKDKLTESTSLVFDMLAKYYTITVTQDLPNSKQYALHQRRLSKNYANYINRLKSKT